MKKNSIKMEKGMFSKIGKLHSRMVKLERDKKILSGEIIDLEKKSTAEQQELEKKLRNALDDRMKLKKGKISAEKEIKEIVNFAMETLETCEEILQVIENQEKARLFKKKIEQLLSRNEFEPTAFIGEEFDPEYHNDLRADQGANFRTEEVNRGEKYIISKIISQGFRQGDKIFKIAQVVTEEKK